MADRSGVASAARSDGDQSIDPGVRRELGKANIGHVMEMKHAEIVYRSDALAGISGRGDDYPGVMARADFQIAAVLLQILIGWNVDREGADLSVGVLFAHLRKRLRNARHVTFEQFDGAIGRRSD